MHKVFGRPAKVENANGNKSFTMKPRCLRVVHTESVQRSIAQRWPWCAPQRPGAACPVACLRDDEQKLCD